MGKRRILVQPDQFARRAAEIERASHASQTASQVSAVEPSLGVWTGNNNFGRQTGFAPDSNNRQSILKMPEWGFPREWTISLELDNTVVEYDGFNITAVIEFGCGGSLQTVRCDWINGTQLTVVANAINVIAEYTNVDLVTEGPGIKLGVQVGRYPRPGAIPPRITILEAQVIPFAQLIEIPKFVGRVGVLPTVATTTFFVNTILFSTVSGNGASNFNVLRKDGTQLAIDPTLPVTGSAKFVSIIVGAYVSPVTIWGDLVF